MTTKNQNLLIYQGEDVDIPVILTDVTLAETETITIKASFFDRGRNTMIVVVDATITSPTTLKISLDSATTAAMRATGGGTLHDWAVWREDEGARTPYLTGNVAVIDTARQ